MEALWLAFQFIDKSFFIQYLGTGKVTPEMIVDIISLSHMSLEGENPVIHPPRERERDFLAGRSLLAEWIKLIIVLSWRPHRALIPSKARKFIFPISES